MAFMSQQPSQMPISERLTLRVNDATAYSGLGRSYLYILMNTGKLASAKVGGRRLILRESLENLLRGRGDKS
jgi:excisionase family DNA binding protein